MENKKTVSKNKSSHKIFDIITPTIVLASICIIVTSILAATNALTKDKIEENSQAAAAEGRLAVLEADSYVQLDEAGLVYKALDENGDALGLVIETSANGYDGEIQVMTGITMEGVVCGVTILDMSETPGMGAKAKESSFLAQYEGVSDSDLSVTKDGGSVDAVSGATITSRAVTGAVNEAIETAGEYLDDLNQTEGE